MNPGADSGYVVLLTVGLVNEARSHMMSRLQADLLGANICSIK